MKKPALALLAVALLLVLALALWLGLDQPQRGAAREAESPGAPVASAPPAAGLQTPAAQELTAPTPQALDAAALAPAPAVSTDARSAASSDGGRRIRGHLELPSGAPADESLRVIALGEALPPRQIYGRNGVLSEKGTPKTRLLGSAPVDARGAFQLALPSAGEVWLAVDGRFLYSAQAQAVPADVESVGLSAELGGCLRGAVRPPAGVEPTALGKIELALGPDSTNFSLGSLGTAPLFGRLAELDEAGRFEVRALPVGLAHGLEVSCDDFADHTIDGLLFEAGRVRELEVPLGRGATLRGLVRDEQGQPVAGAAVIAADSAMWGFPGRELAEAESGADGAFELAHVRAGKALVLAKEDGYLPSESLKLELLDEQQVGGLELRLERGASISGRVRLGDGGAVEGAKVEVDFDPEALVGMGALNAARGAEGEAQCGADGRFTVTGLGKGPFLVQASLERTDAEGNKDTWQVRRKGVKPDTHDLELELAAPNLLRGRVRDLAGAPVQVFTLQVTQPSAVAFLPGETRTQPCEDAQGEFTLRNLSAGAWKLEARAPGFGPMAPLELVLPRGEETPLELVLAPEASVSGTVQDPRGAPVAGAKVTLQAPANERMQRLRAGDQTPEATSGADGTFVLSGLGAGANALVAAREGFAMSEPVTLELASGAREEGVVLALRKGALVTGEVYGKDGKPAGGVQLVAQETSTMEMSMKRSDGAGLFRFEALSAGSWTITALLEGGEVDIEGNAADVSASFMDNMRFTMVQLEDGKEEHVVLGAPPEDPVRVRGRVLHAGKPVDTGLVSFIGEGAKGLGSLKMASLGAEGRFEVELGSPGRYLATVQITAGGGTFQQNSVEFRETIPKAPEYALELNLPLAALRGEVRGPEGENLAGARVTLTTDGGVELGSLMGGHYAEATTDASGRYSFDYLRPGSYAVAAGGALFGGAFGSTSDAGRMVRTGLRVEEGRVLDGIDFRLAKSCDIRGRVVTASGTGLKDAAIFVRDAKGHALDRFSMITSGADGSFTYTGVAPGEYHVSARGKGMASAESAPVHAREGQDASVELVLYPGTTLEIEVVDGEGKALEARVTVLDAQGREMQGMLGFGEIAAGFSAGLDTSRQRVGPLPPGTYSVSAQAADGTKATKPVTLDGQPERKMKLRLR